MIPLAGNVTAAMLRAELGLGTGPVASLLAVGALRRAAGKTAGAVSLSDLRGAHVYRGTAIIQKVYALMGNPAVSSPKYRFVIEPGAVIGSLNPQFLALDYGQFPAGSTITVDDYGNVDGAGGQFGVRNGQGGGAVEADYANQTMFFNVKPGAFLRGGGGAGGRGGVGGRGGQGGPGTSATTVNEGPFYSRTSPEYFVAYVPATGNYHLWWSGTLVADSRQSSVVVGSTTYSASAFSENANYLEGGVFAIATYYQIQRSTTTVAGGGAGGLGGVGGLGGIGGRGQGWDGNYTAGPIGSPGTAGAAGSGNAGGGGVGGTGGYGGYGNSFGQPGGTAGPGGDGAQGNAGAAGAGQAGFTGAAGSTGGAAGSYVHRGLNGNLTLTNNGTVLGVAT